MLQNLKFKYLVSQVIAMVQDYTGSTVHYLLVLLFTG